MCFGADLDVVVCVCVSVCVCVCVCVCVRVRCFNVVDLFSVADWERVAEDVHMFGVLCTVVCCAGCRCCAH